jgi:hypothetical protein
LRLNKANMTEAKNQLSAVPDHEPDGRVLRLIREGIVRPARAALPHALFTDHPVRPNTGASAVGALLDERRVGR